MKLFVSIFKTYQHNITTNINKKFIYLRLKRLKISKLQYSTFMLTEHYSVL